MQKREILRRHLISGAKLSFQEYPHEYGYTISTKYYGVNYNAVVSTSQKSSCLIIYIQGHGGDPFNFEYHNEIREKLVNNDCDFISLSMLGLGLNKGPAKFPGIRGDISLTSMGAKNHGNYSFFHDSTRPQLDPLSLFLFPYISLINHASEQSDYQKVILMGISGGGWYTTWLSALMPSINVSISVAGTLPIAYHYEYTPHGDWEQLYSRLYQSVSYIELYQLMLLDEHGEYNRQAHLVYNSNDPCCFSNPAASHFAMSAKNIRQLPEVHVTENNYHTIKPSLVYEYIDR